MKIEKYELTKKNIYNVYLSNGEVLELNGKVITDNELLIKKDIDNELYNKLKRDNTICILVDTSITWKEIDDIVSTMVKEVSFIEEYNGDKIPEGKKSITLRIKLGNNNGTMTTEQINTRVEKILKVLNKELNITLREE